MGVFHKPLLTDSFLRSVWSEDFQRYKASDADNALEARLQRWAKRRDLGETASEAPFIQIFFHEIWGYAGSGQGESSGSTYRQQYPIPETGQDGGTGRADLALGFFIISLSFHSSRSQQTYMRPQPGLLPSAAAIHVEKITRSRPP